VNVPKFLKDDIPLFENIMSDLFPGISKPIVDYGLLMGTISEVCAEACLIPCEAFVNKIQ